MRPPGLRGATLVRSIQASTKPETPELQGVPQGGKEKVTEQVEALDREDAVSWYT
jgi:hypothetical protein